MKKIIVERLKYQYPMADKPALDGISFEVEAGEKIGVVGQNGAGKSTLCQALVGLVPHFYKGKYGGSVVVDGLNIRESSVCEASLKVGVVFQNPFTQVTGAKETVYEEIAFGLENMGLPRAEMRTRIDDALNLLNIYPFRDQNPFSLSGGQMQRMAIAGIIAMRPGVVVLDEPTSQLDPQGTEEVFAAIDDLSANGMTVILAEHKIEKAAQYCDKILALKDGKAVAFETPEKLFSRDDLPTLGLRPPIYTEICKALGKRDGAYYPVTLDGAARALGLYEGEGVGA